MTNNKIKINLDSLKTRRDWTRHKVKDGHNIFRIAPPFGESSNGYVSRKWQVIWGLIDPASGRVRPFASSMTSEKRCPITEYVNLLKKKADTIKAEMAGEDEDVIKERLTPLNKLISDLNPKTVYVYNAIDKSGAVGLLELKSTAHKQMKAEMAQYVSEYNQDPTSLNSADDDSGVWFDIVRTNGASFRDTAYTVKKCQIKTKKAAGGHSYEDDRSALPESVVESYEKMAYDLSAVYQIKTYDELAAVLEANMPSFIENCPDADLGFSAPVAPTIALAKTKPVTVGKKPVAIRLEEDDEDTIDADVTAPAPATYKTKMPAMATAVKKTPSLEEDDFMRQANALLED